VLIVGSTALEERGVTLKAHLLLPFTAIALVVEHSASAAHVLMLEKQTSPFAASPEWFGGNAQIVFPIVAIGVMAWVTAVALASIDLPPAASTPGIALSAHVEASRVAPPVSCLPTRQQSSPRRSTNDVS
jgi:hypothetical protein